MTIVFDASSALAGTDDGGGNSNANIRIVIKSPALGTASGSSVRLTLLFGTAAPTETPAYDDMFIGQAAATGHEYDFKGNQVRVTFGGGNSINGSAAGVVVSDWVTLSEPYDKTKNYVIALHAHSGASANGSTVFLDNCSIFYDDGGASNSATSVVTMTSTSVAIDFVEKVEISSGGPVAVSLAGGADGLGVPSLATKYGMAATTLASGASTAATPAATIVINLAPTTLASGAANVGTPKPAIITLSIASMACGAAGLGRPIVNFPNVPLIRSISTTSYGNRTNLTLTAPAGIANNDILLAFIVDINIGAEANTVISPPAGFIQVGSDQVVTDASGTFLRGAVYNKLAASESGNYTFTTASGNSEGFMVAVSGVITAGSCIDVYTQASGSVNATSTTAAATQSLNAVSASATTVAAADLAIYLASAFSGYTSAVAPVGINPLFNDIQNGVMFAGWEPEPKASFATGTASMQINSSANAWLAYLICLKSSAAFNALSPTSLAGGAAAFGTPTISQSSAWNVVSLTTQAAAFGTPVFNQGDILSAVTLASGAAGLDQPVFAKSGALTATSFASGAAAFGAPVVLVGNAALGNPVTLAVFQSPSLMPSIGFYTAATAANLATAADGLGLPVFNQSDMLAPASLASQAAAFGSGQLLQNNNTLAAMSLVSQNAGLAQAILQQTLFVFSSSWNYVTTPPSLDTASPALTLSTTYGFNTITLASAAVGFDRPLVNQQQILNANSLASGVDGFGRPQYVEFQALTATSLATGADFIGTPGMGSSSALLAVQLTFASADSNINQLNAALAGMPVATGLSSIVVATKLLVQSSAAAVNLSSAAGLILPNSAALAPSATAIIHERQIMPVGKALLPTSTLSANIGSFIFASKGLSPTTALQASLAQGLLVSASTASIAAVTAQAAMIQPSNARLDNSTALFANATKPVVVQWQNSALLSPSSQLASVFVQGAAANATLSASLSLSANLLPYITAISLAPTSTLGVLTIAKMAATAQLSVATVVAIAPPAQLDAARTQLTATATAAAVGMLAQSANVLLSGTVSLAGSLNLPLSLQARLVVGTTATFIATTWANFTAAMPLITAVTAAEFQQLASGNALTVIPALSNQVQALLSLPSVWNVQAALASNERILPSFASFYFAHAQVAVAETMALAAQALIPLQPHLISHESLQLLQSPMVSQTTTSLTSRENMLQSPVLKLVSNIVLNTATPISQAVAQASLASLTGFNMQLMLGQSLVASVNSGSTLSAVPHMAVAGVATLTPACYLAHEDVVMQRTIEISAIITAQKSRTRIVAQGNLVRKYD